MHKGLDFEPSAHGDASNSVSHLRITPHLVLLFLNRGAQILQLLLAEPVGQALASLASSSSVRGCQWLVPWRKTCEEEPRGAEEVVATEGDEESNSSLVFVRSIAVVINRRSGRSVNST
ncbi:unnamed protein product [Symbiodinium natans]|uniref:Uncharacterized protein n=1 Tax=Symbiodinium natans TaxID=878477 RepID=A0A812T0C5_9DINO|nr:unnamed protein product [Symbiodinium natans]